MKGTINDRQELQKYVNDSYGDDGTRKSIMRLFDLSRGEKPSYPDEYKTVRKSLRNAGILSLPFSVNRKKVQDVLT